MVNGGLMTEQIYYNYWGTQSEEHKDYFFIIGDIARWIGYALIGPVQRPYHSEICYRSNIVVNQTKEKFGTPRVYVTFSEDYHLADAQHYREVYKTALKLFPQYKQAILEGMDYEEYMIETPEELAERTRKKIENLNKRTEDYEMSEEAYALSLDTIKTEEEFIKKVCNFT
jgi:hypothetical protein